ncbi:MAG: hypothetical protein AAGD96_14560 [Chloroflexota bacterium]
MKKYTKMKTLNDLKYFLPIWVWAIVLFHIGIAGIFGSIAVLNATSSYSEPEIVHRVIQYGGRNAAMAIALAFAVFYFRTHSATLVALLARNIAVIGDLGSGIANSRNNVTLDSVVIIATMIAIVYLWQSARGERRSSEH